MVDKRAQLRITVLLAGHQDRVHTCEIDLTIENQFINVLGEVIDRIGATLADKAPLALQFPSVIYSGQHVVGIEYDVIGSDELQAELEKAHRQAGFHPPATSP